MKRVEFMGLKQSRRRVIAVLAMGVFEPFAFAESYPSIGEYTFFPAIATNFPISSIASCEDLEKTIRLFNQEIQRLNSNFTAVGQEVLNRVTLQRAGLTAAIAAGRLKEQEGKIDETFAQINLALSIIFISLGCALAAPAAIGVAAGTSVLVGVGVFAAQAYYKNGLTTPSFVVGYARDRALMFTELGSSEAASSAGRLLNNGVKATTLFLNAYEIYKTRRDVAEAREKLKSASSSLEDVDALITRFGKNTAVWANLYQKHLIAARDSLQQFIDSNRRNQCQPATTIIRKP